MNHSPSSPSYLEQRIKQKKKSPPLIFSSPPGPLDSDSIRPTKLAKMEDSIDVVHATTGTMAIPSYRPDAKERRYDRQLRLWASAGQRSLEAARVLLVGCDATGCQALKNLILPGIAHFTILSPDIATPKEVATNFFLHPDSVGSSIAEQAVNLLKELNPAVEGSARVESPADLLQKLPSFFTSFTIIICSNVDPGVELAISDLLWEASSNVGGPDIPLISIRNSGFIGKVEIQLREHCIADTHPDTTHTLRIDQPFPALEKFARGLDLENMDSMEHSHVPWVVLLVKAAATWKDTHDGILPRAGEAHENERKEFKKLVESWRKKADEENFDEAAAQAYRVWQKSAVPFDLQGLLEEENVKTVTSNSKNLHILLNTLSIYLATHHHLPPLSPTLPDMHSSTTSYIALQNLYKQQYQEDLQKYKALLEEKLSSLGLPFDAIPEDEVESFVKNTSGVGIVKASSLRSRKEMKGKIAEMIVDEWDPEDGLGLSFYLAFQATEKYRSKQGAWPGSTDSVDNSATQIAVEAYLMQLQTISPKFEELSDQLVECVTEIIRGGFSCLPTTAAFLGGIVAQETIKLVTNQYMPLNNTVVANLIKSELEKFEL